MHFCTQHYSYHSIYHPKRLATMHSSFSNNILTQCPAQTCLSVGSSNNYGKGSSNSLRNLPARVLKTGDSSKKSKPVRRSLKSRSKRDATATSKAQTSTSNSRIATKRTLYNPLAVDCLTENVLRIEGAHINVPKGLLARSKSRLLQTQGRSKVTLDHQTTARLPSVPSPTSSTSSGVLAGAKSKSIFPSSSSSSSPKVMAIMERQLGSGDASPLVGLLSTWDSRGDDSTFNNKGSEKSQCVALPLLKQRLGYLWENKMFTDVMFIVGRDKVSIEAHRMILASASEVFQRLLYDEAKPIISDDKFLLYENDFSTPAFEVFIKVGDKNYEQ
ncbi:BTB/POZ domain-containing protein 19 [Orchesella cincta]|uniref:BTB/POZ domain-containing protein 19 n=1 Tax=Orchesella cincta TaxID=48709 RepID=A0A1D2MV72_ORCCI|nr:BTB/POZ domain-containing protein 19 [Orchesella cincta]